MQKVLLKGATGIVVEPVKTKISQLGNAALNTLIQLDDIEFRMLRLLLRMPSIIP